MSDLDRPNVGYEALLALQRQGIAYWLMKTEGGYNFIYADVGVVRRYYAQSTSDRMVVYGYWTRYDDIQAWVRLQQPVVLTILSSSNGSTNPPSGKYVVKRDSNQQVLASANPEYKLDRWIVDGSDAGNDNPISVKMNDYYLLQASFATLLAPPETPTDSSEPPPPILSFLPWLAVPVGLAVTYVVYRQLKK